MVLAHGFGVSSTRPAVRRVADALATRTTVLAYDARGHGRSSGRSTLGEREVLDVDAAVVAAREAGFTRVVTCGFSMGGAAVLRHAGLTEAAGHVLQGTPDAVVSVSAAADGDVPDTAAVRRLRRLVTTRHGRVATRTVLRTRVAPYRPPSPSPLECVGAVAPLPLLLVHGELDGCFGVEQVHALAAAAGPSVRVRVEPGAGHAETGATDGMLARLAEDVGELAA